MSAFGSYFGAQAQRSSLRSQARMAEINATVTDEAARGAIRAGAIEESRVKLAGAQAKSSQIAQMSSRGIDIAGSPTALARLTGTDLITDVDAATVRANALREAQGYRMESVNLRNTANTARASASTISPGLALGTSLIQGAGQVASSWYGMNREGAFSSGGGGSAGSPMGVPTINAEINAGINQRQQQFADQRSGFSWGDIFR